ncbi:MAG: segregation/condensation protein A [Candidatus Woesearchaeota archaeon]
MQDRIFKLVFEEDDITWQSLLHDLVKKEQMNPWDIDVSLLTHKYIGMLRKLSGMDFRVSGKVVLAAAILLKIKSARLVGDDMLDFDRLIYGEDEVSEEEFYGELESQMKDKPREQIPSLVPRTPQPRKRKVSIYDLITALEQALEVKRRRVMRYIPPLDMKIPEKKIDISKVIRHVYARILDFFSSGHTLVTFSELVPSDTRSDKIYTFIPLLYLATHSAEAPRRIDLWQKQHFGEIEVMLTQISNKKEIEAEL